MMAKVTDPGVRFVRAQEVELAYEILGSPAEPPIVLIAGLGAHLVGWRVEFCQQLAGRGFQVVRFDNRDVGLSTRFPAGGYSLTDLADDTARLISALGFESAHVVGQSLGGMIAQELVISHPESVRSLCLLFSTPNLSHFTPAAVAMASTPKPAPRDRHEAIAQYVATESFCASRRYPLDLDWVTQLGGTMWDRGWNPKASQHQVSAMLRSADLTTRLRSVAVPTLVVHGDADPMISPTGGRALAGAIPDADQHVFAGMGNGLPRALWPEIIDLISDNADRAGNGPRPAYPFH